MTITYTVDLDTAAEADRLVEVLDDANADAAATGTRVTFDQAGYDVLAGDAEVGFTVTEQLGERILEVEGYEYLLQVTDEDQLDDPITDVGGYLGCGCHGSQREHSCGPQD